MHLIAFFGLLILLGMLLVTYYKMRHKKAVNSLFAGRLELSEKAFFEQYFAAQGISEAVAVGVRQVLEQTFVADLSCLAAEDDFSQNIRYFFESDSMADVELIIALEEKFSIKISDSEAENIQTIRQLVMLVNEKVSNL